MNFAEAAMMNAAFTRTENGAVALNTTGDARLDFFGTVGSLRGADKERITRLFSEAWKADRCSQRRSRSTRVMSEADWEKDRPSVRFWSLWQSTIRKPCVRTWT